jgi:hypothetical protein
MHYITNENHQIIAADRSLLALLQVEDLAALYTKIALNEVEISLSSLEDEVSIRIDTETTTFDASAHRLSGLLGEMISIDLLEATSKEEAKEEEETPLIDSLLMDETPLVAAEESLDILPALEEVEEETPLIDSLLQEEKEEEPLFDLLDTTTEESTNTDVEEESTQEEELPFQEENEMLFDLLQPAQEEVEEVEKSEVVAPQEESLELLLDETTQEEEEKKEEQLPPEDLSPIVLDIETISQSIGISHEDYDTFLNEYIDTAINLQEDLTSDEMEKRAKALSTLSHLSNVLHLGKISDILVQIKSHPLEEQMPYIDRFYGMLSRITTVVPQEEEPQTPKEEEESTPEVALESISLDVPLEESASEPQEEEQEVSGGFGTLDLSDVKPVHFDFQLEKAASELSLPTDLIEEFVTDYIQQAHEETQKMLEAYKKGDLDAIQKIGHLLKGAASNLRIEPLADTLYEIQFCEDPKQLEKLIPNYWAHFLSLENQMNIISQSK